MTSTPSRSSPIQYARPTVERADRAVRCAPFQLALFTTMQRQSVELRAVVGKTGLQNGYTSRLLPELSAESALLWLIQVGVLRREVDGQGLTDSFRLTPLGHQLVDRWQQHRSLPTASPLDRLYNAVNRWLRLPDWI